MPFCRAAAVVIILKVEPGGWGAEKAWPARARTSPLRASSTAMPPTRPARAETADSCRPGSIVVFTGAPGFGSALAIVRVEPSALTASSEPPGLPGEPCVEGLLEAADPDRGVRREALAGEGVGFGFFGGADFAGDVDRGAADRVRPRFCRSLGEGRAVGGEDRGTRGEFDLAFQVLAAAQAGKDEARSQSTPPSAKGRSRSSSIVPKATVPTVTGTETTLPSP